jgi:hypothetical protein
VQYKKVEVACGQCDEGEGGEERRRERMRGGKRF